MELVALVEQEALVQEGWTSCWVVLQALVVQEELVELVQEDWVSC